MEVDKEFIINNINEIMEYYIHINPYYDIINHNDKIKLNNIKKNFLTLDTLSDNLKSNYILYYLNVKENNKINKNSDNIKMKKRYIDKLNELTNELENYKQQNQKHKDNYRVIIKLLKEFIINEKDKSSYDELVDEVISPAINHNTGYYGI
jgi:vacuolar-type H+-ATPase subunit I/STV1